MTSWYAKNRKKPDGIFLDRMTGRVYEHRGYSKRIYWSRQMVDDLKAMYPTTLNEDMAHIVGVSVRTMIRKARELGLRKDEEWLLGVWNERRMVAHCVNKVHGNSGMFKKGCHASPATEFKKGRRKNEAVTTI